MQIVEQLEGQLAKEQSRLEAMLAHLQQLQQKASKPEPGRNTYVLRAEKAGDHAGLSAAAPAES